MLPSCLASPSRVVSSSSVSLSSLCLLSSASQNASGTPVLGFISYRHTTRTHPFPSSAASYSSSRLSPAGVSGDAGTWLAILGPAYAYAYPYLF